MTKEEKKRLNYYRTAAGEREWRMSDLAWRDYQQLQEKYEQSISSRRQQGEGTIPPV